MDQSQVTAGMHETIAGKIQLTSKVDFGDSIIGLTAEGSGLGTGTGCINLNSNGQIISQAGQATCMLETNITGQSSVTLDGGPLGVVTLANAAPVGNAQTVKLDSLLSSISINNGNVPGGIQSIALDGLLRSIHIANGDLPGTLQKITLDGITQSVEITAGGTPVSPTIQLSPMGIKLSMGPANFIEISPAGVKISGLLVEVSATAQASVEGAVVNVSSTATTAIKGGIVMIQ